MSASPPLCGCAGRDAGEHDRPCKPAGNRFVVYAAQDVETIDTYNGLVTRVRGITSSLYVSIGDPWVKARRALERNNIQWDVARWA